MPFRALGRSASLALIAATAMAAAEVAPDRADRLQRIAEAIEQGHGEVGSLMFALRNLAPTVEEALPIYLRLLRRESDSARGYALLGIAALGPRAASAQGALVALLGEPSASAYVKGEALRSLDAIASEDASLVPVLERSLRDVALTPRAKAPALSLASRLGPDAAALAPLAAGFLDDPDTSVSGAAYLAIGAIAARRASGAPAPGMPVAEQYAAMRDRAGAGDAGAIAAVLRDDPRHAARACALDFLAACATWDEATTAAVVAATAGDDVVLAGCARSTLLGESVRGLTADRSHLPLAPLAAALGDAHPAARRAAADALARQGAAAVPASGALRDALIACDGRRSAVEVLALLDAVRAIGSGAAPAADAIATLLVPQSALFTGRPHREVQRLRARMLATLAAVGVPRSARPQVLDALANPDPVCLLEFVGAARAAGREGRAAGYATPHLLHALDSDFPDDLAEPLSDSPAPHRPLRPTELPRDAVTARVEAIRALAAIADPSTAPRLREAAQAGFANAGNDALLRTELAAALARLPHGATP
jgi:hypothetical protein